MEKIAKILFQFAVGYEIRDDNISRPLFTIRTGIVGSPAINGFLNEYDTAEHAEF